MNTVIQPFLNWFHAPVKQQMDVIQIFLLVGLVLIASVLWGRILAHLQMA